jgi:hypothetical protein
VNSRGFWGRGIVLAVASRRRTGRGRGRGVRAVHGGDPAGDRGRSRHRRAADSHAVAPTDGRADISAHHHLQEHDGRGGLARPPRRHCAASDLPGRHRPANRSGAGAIRLPGLLRATYADASGTLLTTVGIAVMPGATAAAHAFSAIHNGQNAGVRTVSFAGTISGQFGNGKRTLIQTEYQGSYIFFFATGFADGRLTHAAAGYPAIQDLGDGIVNALENTLSQTGNPCQEKDVRC